MLKTEVITERYDSYLTKQLNERIAALTRAGMTIVDISFSVAAAGTASLYCGMIVYNNPNIK